MKKVYQLERLSCPTCVSKIESMLKKVKGVQNVEVLFMSSRIKIEFDENVVSSEELKDRIGRFGYPVISER